MLGWFGSGYWNIIEQLTRATVLENPEDRMGMGMEIFREFFNIPKKLGILRMGLKFVGMGMGDLWSCSKNLNFT